MIDITPYLNQVITVYADNGYDLYGQPNPMTSTTHQARFISMSKTIRFNDGQEKKIDGEVWLEPNVVLENDRIIEYKGTQYRVIESSEKVDLRGDVNHVRLFVQLTV